MAVRNSKSILSDPSLFVLSDRIVQRLNTETLHRLEITWTPIKIRNGGTYVCKAIDLDLGQAYDDDKREKSFHIEVHGRRGREREINDSNCKPISFLIEPKAPKINGKSYDKVQVTVILGSPVRLTCNTQGGLPVPEIKWHKDDVLIENSNRFSTEGNTLVIDDAKMEDTGDFKCTCTNRVGNATKSFELKVVTNLQAWIAGTVSVLLMLVLIVSTVLFVIRYQRVKSTIAIIPQSHEFNGKTFRF